MAGKAEKLNNQPEAHTKPHGYTGSEAFTLRSHMRGRIVPLCVLAGLLSGGVSVLYRLTLTWADTLRSAAFAWAVTPIRIVLLFAGLIALGVVVGLITQSEPLIAGSGIPQVEGQLQGKISPRWFRVLYKKFIAGALSLLGGLALGREGPSIQLGGMLAHGLAERTRRSDIEKKYLIASGACAGLAAAFNAPLAGAMFGLEEVHKNFSKLSLLSALVAAIMADLLAKAVFGTVSSLNIGLVGLLPFRDYAMFIAVGAVMGVVGAFYNTVLLKTQKLYKSLPIPLWARITIPFVFAGAIGLFYPDMLGGGHNVIDSLSNGDYTISLMLILLVGRFIFSMISYGSGAPGGIFFPLLVIGSLTGALLGEFCVAFFGLDAAYVTNFMLLGMAGMFAGVVRAPVTGIILVVEMSGSLTQLAGLTITAAMAVMVADALGSEPIYESLLKVLEGGCAENEKCWEHHIIELSVPMSSPLAFMPVRDFKWPDECLVISVIRGSRDKAEIPRGDTVIMPGDTVCVACPAGKEAELRSAFEREFSESGD
jgi:H+/Cl- antiporter ClcA